MPKNNPSSVKINTSTMVSNDEKYYHENSDIFHQPTIIQFELEDKTGRSESVRRGIWICKLEYCGEYLAPLTIKLLIWGGEYICCNLNHSDSKCN